MQSRVKPKKSKTFSKKVFNLTKILVTFINIKKKVSYLIYIFIKDFPNVDQHDIGGNTALYYACLNKRRSTAEALLLHDADPNE